MVSRIALSALIGAYFTVYLAFTWQALSLHGDPAIAWSAGSIALALASPLLFVLKG